jgi:tetratricopeptide (TPR) repeat protein
MTPPTPGSNRRSGHGFRLTIALPATLLALASVPGAGAIVTLWPAAARAQTPPSLTADQKQEMKIHYERGQRAYDIGKYADAIDEYAKVYEIGGNPAMLFNIAQAHRLNNQLPEALRFYRRYLQRSPNAPNRADVETKIAELEKSVDERGRAPSSSAAVVPPATTPAPPAVNPAPPATSAAPAATPPPKVETPPPPPPTAPVSPPPPAPSASTEPPPVTAPPAPAPAEPTASASNGRTIAVISLLAVGAAGLVLAAFEGLSASSKADTITAQSKAGNTVFDPAIETAGRRANAIAITSGIIGVAALGVGGYLFFSRPTATDEAPGTRVSIAPWVTPSGLIGAGAAWAY